MFIRQHIKFCFRIFILLFLVSTVVLYFISNFKEDSSKTRPSYYKLFKPKIITIKKKSNVKILKSQPFNETSVEENDNRRTILKDDVFRFGDLTAEVKIAVVVCGERLNQTMVTLKSAIVLSRTSLHFIIVADPDNKEKLHKKLLDWPSAILDRISFEIHPITFPNGSEGEEWRKLFKLCACQRLFLPSLLHHIDSIIYIDTDVLFMHPIEDLWQYFYKMNESQIAGLGPEHEDFATGWYNRFARHPYYEPLGVNSGVMLMNLTRMRDFHWETYLQPIMKEYKFKIVWGDQDIINIIFHFHSEKLLVFPCEWNYRPDHCMYSSVCKTAEVNGVYVIHGNRGVFKNNKQPVFKAIYEAVENYKIGSNMAANLLQPMKKLMDETINTNCGKLSPILIKSLENFISVTEIANNR